MTEVQSLYRIRHRTAYEYSGRIDLCHSLAHLAPRAEGRQLTDSHEIQITPTPDFQSEHRDYLGNTTHHFSIQHSHESLEVVSQLTVRKPSGDPILPVSGISWDALEVDPADIDATGARFGNFLLPTPACPHLKDIRDYLDPSLSPGADVMKVANDLMRRIHTDFAFTPGATSTTTPLGEVIEQRKGVCQDFAHLMIAAMRSIGIPCRYVSGYLETLPPPGREKLQGADASHAWVEVWAPDCEWVGFDPTNNKLPGGQHIKICHGRDYFDVQPLRGLFLGSGTQKLTVEVDVERL